MDELAADTDCKHHFVDQGLDIQGSRELVSTKDHWLAICLAEGAPEVVEDIGHSVAQELDILGLQ